MKFIALQNSNKKSKFKKYLTKNCSSFNQSQEYYPPIFLFYKNIHKLNHLVSKVFFMTSGMIFWNVTLGRYFGMILRY